MLGNPTVQDSTNGGDREPVSSSQVSVNINDSIPPTITMKTYYPKFGASTVKDRFFRSKNKSYVLTFAFLYLLVTTLAVVDRFKWNISPRQGFPLQKGWEICEKTKTLSDGSKVIASACGNDYFCGTEEQHASYNGQLVKAVGDDWCLKDGPWTVKFFDICARVSGRVIITTTIVMFVTVSHNTWNALASLNCRATRSFLWNVKADNLVLHAYAGYIIGSCTVIHVWSLLLPSIFSGYKNHVHLGEPFTWPAQISLPLSQIDSGNKQANWGLDDVWRICWMTIIFCGLFPLSRAVRFLSANYSLAMWLHVLIGLGYFFDNWRRRSHPHVWLYNTPFVLWYVCDRLVGLFFYRTNTVDKVRRFKLDDNYQVLMWKHSSVATRNLRAMCDIYRLKGVDRGFFEWYHPFTCCSNRYLYLGAPGCVSPSDLEEEDDDRNGLTTLEEPDENCRTDHHWEGHKFMVEEIVVTDAVTKKKKRVSIVDVLNSKKGDEELGEKLGGLATRRFCPENYDGDNLVAIQEVGEGDFTNKPSKVEPANSKDDRVATKKKFEKRRTSAFTAFRKKVSVAKQDNAVEFDQMAVIRVNKDTKDNCVTHASETKKWADKAGEDQMMNVQGPFRSEYCSIEKIFTRARDTGTKVPPLIIVATGAGAGLALDVVSYIRSSRSQLDSRVDIIFSTWSLALMQFVTNELMRISTKGLFVTAAITRMDGEKELDDQSCQKTSRSKISFSRLDLQETIKNVGDLSTEVFFCGSGIVSKQLEASCQKKGLRFVGAAVEN